jgi:hypothetical protein
MAETLGSTAAKTIGKGSGVVKDVVNKGKELYDKGEAAIDKITGKDKLTDKQKEVSDMTDPGLVGTMLSVLPGGMATHKLETMGPRVFSEALRKVAEDYKDPNLRAMADRLAKTKYWDLDKTVPMFGGNRKEIIKSQIPSVGKAVVQGAKEGGMAALAFTHKQIKNAISKVIDEDGKPVSENAKHVATALIIAGHALVSHAVPVSLAAAVGGATWKAAKNLADKAALNLVIERTVDRAPSAARLRREALPSKFPTKETGIIPLIKKGKQVATERIKDFDYSKHDPLGRPSLKAPNVAKKELEASNAASKAHADMLAGRRIDNVTLPAKFERESSVAKTDLKKQVLRVQDVMRSRGMHETTMSQNKEIIDSLHDAINESKTMEEATDKVQRVHSKILQMRHDNAVANGTLSKQSKEEFYKGQIPLKEKDITPR